MMPLSRDTDGPFVKYGDTSDPNQGLTEYIGDTIEQRKTMDIKSSDLNECKNLQDGFSRLLLDSNASKCWSINAKSRARRKYLRLLGQELDSKPHPGIWKTKQNRLLIPIQDKKTDMNHAVGSKSFVTGIRSQHVDQYRDDSALISSRIDYVKMELLKRSNQAAEAERLRKVQETKLALQERERKQRAEQQRAEQQRAEQQRAEQQRADEQLKTKESLKISSNTSTGQGPETTQANKAALQRDKFSSETNTSRFLIDQAMQRRLRFSCRVVQVKELLQNKQLKKTVNGCRMMIQQMGETVRALRQGYIGTAKNFGPGKFLSEIQCRKPELLPAAFHIVAESTLKFGTVNVAPDCIKNGETKFALVYLTVILSINFEGYFEIFKEALCTRCPYSVPGLRDAIVSDVSRRSNDRDEFRHAIGYVDGESNSDYIARMQAHLGFQAGVLQTSVRILQQLDVGIGPGATHPCVGQAGGIVEAWRWLAQTANLSPSRWTPYLIQAFVAVCGHELSRYSGEQTKKLLCFFCSAQFVEKCKEVGDFDARNSDNDVDRFEIFKMWFSKIKIEFGGTVPPPGRDGIDARSLVVDLEYSGRAN